jgi:hypothetical protein
MAAAESRSITRRVLVAGCAILPAAFTNPSPSAAAATADPIHAAIEAHARAYAAYQAQHSAEPEDEVALEPLIDSEREAADALASTVATTLAGAAAALSYVHALHARDNYPILDDFGCYVLIASAASAMRRALDRDGSGSHPGSSPGQAFCGTCAGGRG